MKCIKCGAEIAPNQMFCGNCGSRQELQQQDNPFAGQQAPQQNNAYAQYQAQQQSQQQAQPNNAYTQYQTQQQSNPFVQPQTPQQVQIPQQTQVQAQPSYAPTQAPTNTTGTAVATASKKSMLPILIASLAVIAVAVVVFVFFNPFASSNSKHSAVADTSLGKSYNDIMGSLEESSNKLTETIPAVNVLSEIPNEQYSYDFTLSAEGQTFNFNVLSDIKNMQYKISTSYMGQEVICWISRNYLTVEAPGILEGSYGISFDTLMDDLKDSVLGDYMGMMMPGVDDIIGSENAEIFDLFFGLAVPEEIKNMDYQQLAEEVLYQMGEFVIVVINSFEDESMGTESISIDGKSYDAKKYKLNLSGQKLIDGLKNIINKVIDNKTFEPFLKLALDSIGQTKDDLKQLISEALDQEGIAEQIEQELEMELYTYIYNDSFVGFDFKFEDDCISGRFNPVDVLNFFEIKVDSGDETQTISFRSELSPNTYMMIINASEVGLRYTSENKIMVSYNYMEISDNFKISAYTDGNLEGEIVLDVDSTVDGKVKIGYSDDEGLLEVLFEQKELPNGWFAQNSNFTNILKMSQMDIMSLFASSSMGSLMG